MLRPGYPAQYYQTDPAQSIGFGKAVLTRPRCIAINPFGSYLLAAPLDVLFNVSTVKGMVPVARQLYNPGVIIPPSSLTGKRCIEPEIEYIIARCFTQVLALRSQHYRVIRDSGSGHPLF